MEHLSSSAAAAMSENEAIRRSLLVVTFTMGGTILEANEVFLKVLGYTQEEIKGKHHRLIVPSASASSREYEEFWERLNRGEVQAAEFKRIGKGGKEVWLWATYTPVLDVHGKPYKVVKIATDVTEHKLRTAELEAQSKAIRISQAVVAFSMDGTIVDANSLFLDAMGYTLEEITGKQHRMLVSSKYAASQEYVEFWERLNNGEFHTAECKRIGKDGKEVWWQATYTPILDLNGRPYKVIKFATDLTEQKRRYAELDRQKSMFLANMSHEIRTPMNGIFGMLSLLRDMSLDSAACSYVDTCMRSAESLLAVLNDILLFSKADAGAIQLERTPFNLNSTIEDVLHIVASNVTSSQDIDITSFMKPDVPMFLIGDGSRLRQVLLNLLSNAVKFTKYGEVSLDVSAQARKPVLMLKFDVNDTGIGISESDQARLFSPFSQVDPSVTRQHGGTGLGLSICKHLVTLFGGEISVQSRPGRGSTFSFSACFTEDPARMGQSLALALDMNEDTNFLRNLHVLIIDDNATNCVALETMLQQFGCRATSARSGMDGIDILRARAMQGEPIDLLLLDYHMPHMSGIDVARAIARLGLTPKIIALASNIDAKLSNEPNVLAFSVKPVRRGQLLHMIRSVMVGSYEQSYGVLAAAASSPKLRRSPAQVRPAAPIAAAEEKKTDQEALGTLRGVCVLLAEDNDVNRRVVGNLLQQERCKVIEAVNGVEAVDKLSDNVQVVLMDVHMPVLDGIAATRLLLQKRPALPVVYLTADVTEETRRKCQESGARYILLKPVNKPVLVKTLSRVLHEEPQQPAAAGATAAQSPSPKPSSRFRCLIVDDVNTNRVLAAHLVRKVIGQESEIGIAESGPEAIKYLSEQRSVDLVLMDVKMPGMSGIEATRRIRALSIPQMRIVGVTGFDDDATIRECIAAGMNTVLTKPLRESQLRELLSKPPPRVAAAAPKRSLLQFDDTIFRELDETTRNELLRDWRSNSLEHLAQMKILCARQEWKNLGDVAHTLKGSAAQLGAITLSEKAACVHELARSDVPPQPLSALSIAMEELDATLAATLAHLATYSFITRTETTDFAIKKPKGKSKD